LLFCRDKKGEEMSQKITVIISGTCKTCGKRVETASHGKSHNHRELLEQKHFDCEKPEFEKIKCRRTKKQEDLKCQYSF